MSMNWPARLCPFGLLIVGVIVSGLLGFLAYRSGQKKVRLAHVVKCKVAEMHDGVCRVRGRLVAREAPLKSPLTDKSCLYFHFKVEQAYEIKSWTTRYGGRPSWPGPTKAPASMKPGTRSLTTCSASPWRSRTRRAGPTWTLPTPSSTT